MASTEALDIYGITSFADALVAGGDARLDLDPETGLNRYGCAPAPRDALPLGSCSASSPSERGFSASRAMWDRLVEARSRGLEALERCVAEAFEDLRGRLRHELGVDSVGGVEVAFTPSGTDAELLASFIALDTADELCNIVVAPAEVGGGTSLAAGGRHFDTRTPIGPCRTPGGALTGGFADKIKVHPVGLRDAAGRQLPTEVVDEKVGALAREALAAGQRVLLHVVAHSKTGAHVPALGAARELARTHGSAVRLIVDAAQGRISRRGLRDVMQAGFIVLFTGSKFYGGPPFSGALLLPESLSPQRLGLGALPEGVRDYFTAAEMPRGWTDGRASLSQTPNIGLLLRWAAAMSEIEGYYELEPQSRYQILRTFETMVPELFSSSRTMTLEPLPPPVLDDLEERLLESKRTVFSFRLHPPGEPDASFSRDELMRFFQWANADMSDRVSVESAEDREALRAKYHIGQPVPLNASGDLAVLRIALGAALVRQIAEESGTYAPLVRLGEHLTRLRRKLELLVEAYPRLRGS